MGVRYPSAASSTVLSPNAGINTETVIVTTPPLSPPLDGGLVMLWWFMGHAIGATAVLTTYRVRRGTTAAGTLVSPNPGSYTVAPGNVVIASGLYVDAPGSFAGLQYSLTVIDNGSTAAGNIAEATLIAFVL